MRSLGMLTSYAGAYSVARVNPVGQSVVWRKQSTDWGSSTALVYKEWSVGGYNLIVGGACDT